MKRVLLLPLLFISLLSFTQIINKINIVPEPAEININQGTFDLNKNTIIIAALNDPNANLLNSYLHRTYGFKLTIKANSEKKQNVIYFAYMHNESGFPKEGYRLSVTKDKIQLGSIAGIGTFYGIQTLLQLLPATKKPPLSIPQLSIKDHPRFPYRGMHLDVGRHFFPPAVVKEYIDYLAYHKFNTFHWHLTEDQGWRIEIKKYPKLTSVGGYRNGTIIGRNPGKGNDSIRYGGFYTQQEIKDIVKYAADRYITVIPEIEMPGHSSAAIAAYPRLSCFPDEPTIPAKGTAWAGPRTGKQVQQAWGIFEDVFCPTEYTFNFLEDVLDEVIQLFPSKYIHIGGDECPKASWKRSEFCQQLIKEKGLKDEHGLQSYFIQRIEKYVNSKGRKIIGWDEILEGGLAPNATVMSWRGERGGIEAAKQKHDVIMTPEAYMYFNLSQSTHEDSLTYGQYLPVEKVYSYEPVPKELNKDEAKYVLGAQGNVWSEYINNPKRLEYMVFPRMSALSEVLWSPKEKRTWADFEKKLPALFKRYEQWGAQYSKAYYELRPSILPSPNYDGVLWKLETRDKNDEVLIAMLDTTLTEQTIYMPRRTREIKITETGKYIALVDSKEGSKHPVIQKFYFNKATGKKITLTNPPMGNWTGSGAFTLVNGIITENKLTQSKEWVGFLGKDLDAVIDLGKEEKITTIRLNVLNQENSWIYLPASVEFFISNDGTNFTSAGKVMPGANGSWKDERRIEQKLDNTVARYIKVLAKNYGKIPDGKPGAGSAAWLFADEIEVE